MPIEEGLRLRLPTDLLTVISEKRCTVVGTHPASTDQIGRYLHLGITAMAKYTIRNTYHDDTSTSSGKGIKPGHPRA